MLTKSSPNCHLQFSSLASPSFHLHPSRPRKLQFLEQDLSAPSLLHAVSSGRILPLLPFQPDDSFFIFPDLTHMPPLFQTKVFLQHWLPLLYSLFSFTFRLTKDFFSYIRDISVLTSKILVRRLHISHMPWSTYLYNVFYTVATSLLFMEWIDWHLEQMFVGAESYWVATSFPLNKFYLMSPFKLIIVSKLQL